MEMFKKEYKALLLSLGYLAMAELVYITLMVKFDVKWYFILLAALGILAVGCVIGFFYIKSEYKNHLEAREAEMTPPQVKDTEVEAIEETKDIEEEKETEASESGEASKEE